MAGTGMIFKHFGLIYLNVYLFVRSNIITYNVNYTNLLTLINLTEVLPCPFSPWLA